MEPALKGQVRSFAYELEVTALTDFQSKDKMNSLIWLAPYMIALGIYYCYYFLTLGRYVPEEV